MRVQTNFLGVQAIAKLEGTVSKCALTLTLTARVGYYKTTHRLNNPLEGLSELPERSYPHSYSLLQRRRQEHQPRGEADRVEYRQVSNMGLPLFSVFLSGQLWVTICIVLSTKEVHPSLIVQRFYWGSII